MNHNNCQNIFIIKKQLNTVFSKGRGKYFEIRKVRDKDLVLGLNLNKRAQRALGRSPEEKVKGQGKAIYRGPLMLSTKYW